MAENTTESTWLQTRTLLACALGNIEFNYERNNKISASTRELIDEIRAHLGQQSYKSEYEENKNGQ